MIDLIKLEEKFLKFFEEETEQSFNEFIHRKMTNLFQNQEVILHSGAKSNFKIECDALADEDWESLAYLIHRRIEFNRVVAIPTGGYKLANALSKYVIQKPELPILIVDDVLTTGSSMEKMKKHFGNGYIVGVVVFARGSYPDWVTPIFKLW